MDYEDNLKKLNEIILKLEDENLPLNNMVELYTNADILCKQCLDYLQKTKGEVFKIKQNLENYSEEKIK